MAGHHKFKILLMELKRVVVTGVGAITPLGKSVAETWENLQKGTSGIDMISRFDTTNFKTKFACEVKDYDPKDYFDRKESRKMDMFVQFAVIAADQAIADANLDAEGIDKNEVGVIWGAGIGGIQTFQKEVEDWAKGSGVPRFNPFFIPKLISDIAPGEISIRHGYHGPNYGVVAACASSTNAMINAFNTIQLGKADVIVTGGSEACLCESGVGGFNSMQAISTNNAEYKTASRPFCNTRDGFVMGEGGVCLILEELEHAKARGAKIYGEVAGGGMSADAHHLTAPHPEGLGAIKVIERTLKDAGMKPEDIDYINVHGTATPRGDIAETIAVKEVFGEHAYKLNISSTKSMTGHLLGAAGALEGLVALLSTRDDIVPPTINHHEMDDEIDPKLNLTLGKAQKRTVNAALSNTFGFGGHNASIIFKKYKA